MSGAAVAAIPAAGRWRTRVRRARRAHHDRSLGDVLTDLYMLFIVVVVYGGGLVAEVRRHLAAGADASTGSPERYWIGAAVLLAGAGLAWRGLHTLGPLLASPAEQAWGLSTPVDRRGWLLPRFVGLLLGAVLVGVVAAVAVAVMGGRIGAIGWDALAGGALGVALAASAVVAQRAPSDRRWPRLVGAVLTGAGAVIAAVVVSAHYQGRSLLATLTLREAVPLGMALAAVGVPLAALQIVMAGRRLAGLDRSRLGAGAELATAAMSAAMWLDPSLLSGVLEVRRWRRVGRVRSRSMRPLFPGRTGVLVQADLGRLTRRPGALVAWAALALVQYAVAVVAPAAVGAVHVIVAYLVATRLMGGLRSMSRSAGLRRALGGGEMELRLAHVVVPALGTALWWAVTWPAAGAHSVVLEYVLTAGVVAAAYRSATAPPMSYGSAVVETPFGLVPVELIFQIARGPDVLAGVLLIRAIFGG